MKKLNAAFALIFLLVMAPILSVAQVVINPGGGGSSSSAITPNSTTTTAAAGSTFYSDGTLVQALQMQALLAGNLCTSAVGTDAYACSPPAPQACTGMTLATAPPVYLTTDVANTGASTFAYCGLAAKAIVKAVPTASVATVTGDMIAAAAYLLVYNATGDNWKIVGTISSVGLVNASNTWTGGSNTYGGTVATNGGLTSEIIAVTTTATTSASTSDETYTNTGDTDGATITLMDNPTTGTRWYLAVTVAQTLTIAASAGETLIHEGATCGTSLTSNTIGSTIQIRTVVAGSGGTFMTFGGDSGTWTCNA